MTVSTTSAHGGNLDAALGAINPVAPTAGVDAELTATSAIAALLAPLGDDGRRRVLRYLADACGVPLAAGPSPAIDPDELLRQAAAWASAVLDMLDPTELQQRALDSLGLGDDPDPTKPLFEAIKQAWRITAGTEEATELWRST